MSRNEATTAAVSSAEAAPGGTPSRLPRASGRSLLTSELRVLFARRRTWAMLLALSAIPILLALVMRFASEPLQPGEGPPFLDRATRNGLFIALTALIMSVPLFLPLTVAVVAGDAIAGEAGMGTLRYLLVAPAGRVRLLAVKLVAALAFCLTATLVVVGVGAGIGALLFPVGQAALLSGDMVGPGTAMVRELAAAGYVALSLVGLCAIGLFISTLTDVPIGAMAATMVLIIVVQVLDALPQVAWLHPWLFSHYWLGVGDMLRSPIVWDSLGRNAVLQLGYLLVFGSLAYSRFTTKDILS